MFERPPSCFPLPSRCKSNASARSKGPAVFSPFLLFAALPWVTLSICFSGKQGDRLFKPWSASPCGHHPLLLYPLLPCWAKPAHHTIYHPHHVTVSYFQRLLKLSGKGTSGIFFNRKREENEREKGLVLVLLRQDKMEYKTHSPGWHKVNMTEWEATLY